MMTLGITLLVIFAALVSLLYVFQPRMLYFPLRQLEATPAEADMTYENVYIDTGDGVGIHGWYVPADGATYSVLFCHGNAGNISHRIESIELFHRLGLNCLIFDYRGYGQSEGRPTEKGTYFDAQAAFDWIKTQKQISDDKIILFGRSLGAAVASRIAADNHPAGLVLESAFTSFTDIAGVYYPFLPVKLFTRFDYSVIENVKRIACPVLVIHSPDDEIIPYSMGQRLYDAAPSRRQFLEIHGGHNDGFYESLDVYLDGWKHYLLRLQSPD